MGEIPRLPSMVMEKILYHLDNSDKKSCRLVCHNFMYLIDVFIGVGLKMARGNKAKLFASVLLRSCTSLKIYESAGLLNWSVCYFSPTNLKTVDILENILCDNWKLLLQQCRSMQFLTIVVHVKTYNSIKKDITFKDKHFNFPAEITEKINHGSLRRIVFKGLHASMVNTTRESHLKDCTSIANMLDTIGRTPSLSQVVIISVGFHFNSQLTDLMLKPALLSLMQRNPEIKSLGLMHETSCCEDLRLWDKYLDENKSIVVHHSGEFTGWTEVFDRLLMVDTLYYRIRDESQYTGFRILIANIVSSAFRNLKKLFLVLCSGQIVQYDCILLLQGLQNLTELSLCCFRDHRFRLPADIRISNLNFLANFKLEYLYISIDMSEENLDGIFTIPKLKELHIKHQQRVNLRFRHIQMIIGHPSLKLIFWQTSYQNKWIKFNEKTPAQNWSHLKLETKPIVPINFKDTELVILLDEGYMRVSDWKKKNHAQMFAVYKPNNLDKSDWDKIREYHLKNFVSADMYK